MLSNYPIWAAVSASGAFFNGATYFNGNGDQVSWFLMVVGIACTLGWLVLWKFKL